MIGKQSHGRKNQISIASRGAQESARQAMALVTAIGKPSRRRKPAMSSEARNTFRVRRELFSVFLVVLMTVFHYGMVLASEDGERLKADFDRTARKKMWVSAPLVDIHACASQRSKVIASIYLGSRVYVFDEVREWVRIKWYDTATVIDAVLIDQQRRKDDLRLPSAADSVRSVFAQGGWVRLEELSHSETRITDIADWRRKVFVRRYPELDAEMRDAVLSGRIVLGMTLEMLEASIGGIVNKQWLDRRTTSVGEWGTRETLNYVFPEKGSLRLVLENGKLISYDATEY